MKVIKNKKKNFHAKINDPLASVPESTLQKYLVTRKKKKKNFHFKE